MKAQLSSDTVNAVLYVSFNIPPSSYLPGTVQWQQQQQKQRNMTCALQHRQARKVIELGTLAGRHGLGTWLMLCATQCVCTKQLPEDWTAVVQTLAHGPTKEPLPLTTLQSETRFCCHSAGRSRIWHCCRAKARWRCAEGAQTAEPRRIAWTRSEPAATDSKHSVYRHLKGRAACRLASSADSAHHADSSCAKRQPSCMNQAPACASSVGVIQIQHCKSPNAQRTCPIL